MSADPGRRAVLLSGLVAAGAGALAACSSPARGDAVPRGSATPSVTPSVTASPLPSGDIPEELRIVAAAAALENLAVQAYAAGISAASSGALGAVPPAVVALATTARGHHQDHADGWNALLSREGLSPVTDTALSVAAGVLEQAAAAHDPAGLLAVLGTVERLAAATYIRATATATRQLVVVTAASLAPVEAEHAAVISLLLSTGPDVAPAGLWDDTGALEGASYLG
jgi:hypothetical protein